MSILDRYTNTPEVNPTNSENPFQDYESEIVALLGKNDFDNLSRLYRESSGKTGAEKIFDQREIQQIETRLLSSAKSELNSKSIDSLETKDDFKKRVKIYKLLTLLLKDSSMNDMLNTATNVLNKEYFSLSENFINYYSTLDKGIGGIIDNKPLKAEVILEAQNGLSSLSSAISNNLENDHPIKGIVDITADDTAMPDMNSYLNAPTINKAMEQISDIKSAQDNAELRSIINEAIGLTIENSKEKAIKSIQVNYLNETLTDDNSNYDSGEIDIKNVLEVEIGQTYDILSTQLKNLQAQLKDLNAEHITLHDGTIVPFKDSLERNKALLANILMIHALAEQLSDDIGMHGVWSGFMTILRVFDLNVLPFIGETFLGDTGFVLANMATVGFITYRYNQRPLHSHIAALHGGSYKEYHDALRNNTVDAFKRKYTKKDKESNITFEFDSSGNFKKSIEERTLLLDILIDRAPTENYKKDLEDFKNKYLYVGFNKKTGLVDNKVFYNLLRDIELSGSLFKIFNKGLGNWKEQTGFLGGVQRVARGNMVLSGGNDIVRWIKGVKDISPESHYADLLKTEGVFKGKKDLLKQLDGLNGNFTTDIKAALTDKINKINSPEHLTEITEIFTQLKTVLGAYRSDGVFINVLQNAIAETLRKSEINDIKIILNEIEPEFKTITTAQINLYNLPKEVSDLFSHNLYEALIKADKGAQITQIVANYKLFIEKATDQLFVDAVKKSPEAFFTKSIDGIEKNLWKERLKETVQSSELLSKELKDALNGKIDGFKGDSDTRETSIKLVLETVNKFRLDEPFKDIFEKALINSINNENFQRYISEVCREIDSILGAGIKEITLFERDDLKNKLNNILQNPNSSDLENIINNYAQYKKLIGVTDLDLKTQALKKLTEIFFTEKSGNFIVEYVEKYNQLIGKNIPVEKIDENFNKTTLEKIETSYNLEQERLKTTESRQHELEVAQVKAQAELPVATEVKPIPQVETVAKESLVDTNGELLPKIDNLLAPLESYNKIEGVQQINTDALMKGFKESNQTDFTKYLTGLSDYQTAVIEIENRTIRIGEHYLIFTGSVDQLNELKSNIGDVKIKNGKLATSNSNLSSIITKLIKKVF